MTHATFKLDFGAEDTDAERHLRLLVGDATQNVEGLPLSLSHGIAGLALFLMYVGALRPDLVTRAEVQRAFAAIAARLPRERVTPGLFSGLAGIAWVSLLAEQEFGYTFAGSFFQDIDRYLCELVESGKLLGHAELMEGLAGLGVYALRRTNAPLGRRLLNAVVAQILLSSQSEEDGTIYWPTMPNYMPDPSNAHRYSTGYRDLGMAHGMVGIISFLVRCLPYVGEEQELLPAISSGWAWLARATLSSGISYFAEEQVEARQGWCYGAPTLFLLLHQLRNARVIRDSSIALERECVRIISRPASLGGALDLGLCHGTAGLSLLYRRIAVATGNDDWRRQEISYSRVTGHNSLRMLSELGGVFFLDPTSGRWIESKGMLNGTVGVGMCQIELDIGVNPGWREFLLL